MIDIETQVLNAVATVIETLNPNALVSNTAMLVPPQFPCVAVYEQNSTVPSRRADSAHSEKFNEITYVVDVTSNKRLGAKSEAKALLAAADAVMYDLNFTRVGMVSNDYLADASYYRITARYNATVGADEKLYRR